MIKLTNVEIHKYKSVEEQQNFSVEEDITVLVGMNESGKTSILEALAKSNYFDKDDDDFSFNMTHDFPRRQLKSAQKEGNSQNATTLTYSIGEDLKEEIESDLGVALKEKTFSRTITYDGGVTWGISNFVNVADFWKNQLKNVTKETMGKAQKIKTRAEFIAFSTELKTDENKAVEYAEVNALSDYFPDNKWANSLEFYICVKYLVPNLPKFMYYDEYYALPSRIPLEKINTSTDAPSEKTAKALLELADIEIDNVVKANDYEDFIAELEATQNLITDELFRVCSLYG